MFPWLASSVLLSPPQRSPPRPQEQMLLPLHLPNHLCLPHTWFWFLKSTYTPENVFHFPKGTSTLSNFLAFLPADLGTSPQPCCPLPEPRVGHCPVHGRILSSQQVLAAQRIPHTTAGVSPSVSGCFLSLGPRSGPVQGLVCPCE